VALHSTFDVPKFKICPEDFCPPISPKSPPPRAAASLAFLAGSGSIIIFSPVTGSVLEQLKDSKIIDIIKRPFFHKNDDN